MGREQQLYDSDCGHPSTTELQLLEQEKYRKVVKIIEKWWNVMKVRKRNEKYWKVLKSNWKVMTSSEKYWSYEKQWKVATSMEK